VFDTNEIQLISDHNIKAYGFFAYSTDIFGKMINDEILGVKRQRIVKSGLLLSTNNMIQGESILIPLTSNIGHQNQAQVIIHFDNAEPDLGRKGFQPELRGVAEKISVAIVSARLDKWRSLLRANTGAPIRVKEETDIHTWIRDQQDYEQQNPLRINNENFFLPTKEISITSKPICEQDVIVLFNQLLAGGVIRSIKLMAASTFKQYDGLFKYVISAPIENHIYNSTTNPLGVCEPYSYQENYESMPYVLEYKYSFDALVDEFSANDKNPKDISLCIVWEMGEKWRQQFTIVSLLFEENRHTREFHGITHRIHDSSTGRGVFNCIVLSELIYYLNDANKYETEYSSTYTFE
jgi:hypothetical protein